jgi:hypothetical protein
MRTIVKVMLVLAVAALFWSAAATSALGAKPVWQVCTNLEAKIGLFEDKGCTKEKAGSEYEWLEVTGTEKTMEKGTVALKVTDSTIKVEVKCSTTGEGVIGPKSLGRVTKATFEKCTSSEHTFCPEPVSTIAVDLPWNEELFETEKAIRDRLENSGKGAPGWEAACGEGTEKIVDRCFSEKNPLLEDIPDDVDSILEAKSGKESCLLGEGIEEGTTRIEGSSGKGLRVAPLPEFRAPNNEGQKVKFTIEQTLNNSVVLKLDENKILGEPEGEIWCPSGVTFTEQELTVPAEYVKLEPKFPASCKANFGSTKAESVEVGSCPLFEISSPGSTSFPKACEYKIKLPVKKECIIEISAMQSLPIIRYTGKGTPQDVLAEILTGEHIMYTTKKECGLPSGSKGTFTAGLVLKGFVVKNETRESISIEVK